MTDKDKAMHKGLMKILNDGTFPLQARDVPVFQAVYAWANNIPEMLKPKHEFKPENIKPLEVNKKTNRQVRKKADGNK